MPSRRHKPSPSPAPQNRAGSTSPAAGGAPSAGRDPAELFAAALRETDARDKAKRESEQRQRDEAERRAAEAQAQQRALAEAKRDLDQAINAVRDAKANGRGRVQADQRWKAAKARVIELETGTAPAWAPPPPVEPAAEAEEVESVESVEPDEVHSVD
jgi:hypothetical protein